MYVDKFIISLLKSTIGIAMTDEFLLLLSTGTYIH